MEYSPKNNSSTDSGLFALQYRGDQSLEGIKLGPSRQWVRILRGQGPELHKVPGYLGIRKDSDDWQLREWRFSGFASNTQGGQEYYYAEAPEGNEFSGQPVSQLSADEFFAPGFITGLHSFLCAICERYRQIGYEFSSTIWDGLLYSDEENQFLLLPPEFLHFLAQRSPDALRIEHLLPFQIPCIEADNSQRWAYALAALFYWRLCDSQPFPASNWKNTKTGADNSFSKNINYEELLHDAAIAMRSGIYIDAALVRPELAQPWAKLLKELLCNPQKEAQTREISSLAAWDFSQKERGSSPLWRECSATEHEEAAQKLQVQRKKREQTSKRKHFWRKRRGIVALALGLSLALGVLLYTPLQRWLSPPAHYNYSAYKTAQLYYEAINELDPQQHTQLSYQGNQIVKADANMLTVLFVNIQTRKGYEGRDVLLPIKIWLSEKGFSEQAGSPIPAIGLDSMPYGITQLSVKQPNTGQNRALFLSQPLELGPLQDGTTIALQANYSIWLPGSFSPEPSTKNHLTEQLPTALQPLHYQNIDRLTLIYRARKKAWYVQNIERQSQLISHALP